MKVTAILSIVATVILFASSAFATSDTITISAPVGGSLSPVSSANFANGQFPAVAAAVSAAGYEITGWEVYVDGKSVYEINNTAHINTYVCTTAGKHTVKITAWDSIGNHDSYEASSVDVTGSCTGGGGEITIPSDAIVSHNIDQICSRSSSCPGGWQWKIDPNGGGTGLTTGSTSSLVKTMPTRTGSTDSLARLFDFVFTGGWADELFSVHIPKADGSTTSADDTQSTNFVYDAWIDIDQPEKLYALEFDMNQGISSGGKDYQVIFGLQCNLDKNVWQYRDGTRVDTNVPCERSQFSANKWHHVQIYFQRDGLRSIFNSIAIDNDYKEFLTGSGAHPSTYDASANGWPKGLMVLNFQTDALGDAYQTGKIKAYLDQLTLSRW
jgi:hypothetical protein